jgi:hypothetical protein
LRAFVVAPHGTFTVQNDLLDLDVVQTARQSASHNQVGFGPLFACAAAHNSIPKHAITLTQHHMSRWLDVAQAGVQHGIYLGGG